MTLTDEQLAILHRNGYDIAWHGEDETWNDGITTRKPWLVLKKRGSRYSRDVIDRRCYSWEDCLLLMTDARMSGLNREPIATDEDSAFNEDI